MNYTTYTVILGIVYRIENTADIVYVRDTVDIIYFQDTYCLPTSMVHLQGTVDANYL